MLWQGAERPSFVPSEEQFVRTMTVIIRTVCALHCLLHALLFACTGSGSRNESGRVSAEGGLVVFQGGETPKGIRVACLVVLLVCARGGGGVGQIGMVDRQNVLPVLWCAWLMLPLQQVCRSLQKQCTTARSHTF